MLTDGAYQDKKGQIEQGQERRDRVSMPQIAMKTTSYLAYIKDIFHESPIHIVAISPINDTAEQYQMYIY